MANKFEKSADPELPGHLLLEQYQAQLVSAVRTTLDTSSSPSLLEAGLHLATKWNLFLDGLESPIVSSKLRPCLDESWPVILQALALDAVPVDSEGNEAPIENTQKHSATAHRYSMVELKCEDFKFLWGFSLLGLFQSQHPALCKPILQLAFVNAKHSGNLPSNDVKPSGLKLYEIVLPMFQFLLTERFFGAGLLPTDICKELLQILSYTTYIDNSWHSLAVSILSEVAQNCPRQVFNSENLALITMELCLGYLFKVFRRVHALVLSSADTTVTHPNTEVNVIQTLCSATNAVINCIDTKNPKSVVLALVLISYKCVREASTEVCLSEAIEMVNCTSPLLKRIIDDEPEPEPDDSIIRLRAMFGTCLSVVAALTKDCIEGFHLQEVKNFNQRRIIHTKLAFSLEQIISVSKLALESKYAEDCEARNSICVGALKYCIRCIQTLLIDSNTQVQVIGLQFLKARIQRGVNIEDNSFMMFVVGELITDIFTLIHKLLKNTITRESVTIASECLSLLVLLQTLSKGNDCQRSFMNLLLEAIVMIFLSTEAGFSQEVSDLRSTAVKLVSRLAQIPSSAIHFKDVLLSMPPHHRQQLQGVIRASVTHDKNPIDLKVPVLDIKLPKPSEGSEVKHSVPSPAAVMQTDDNDKEEDEVSEDDWDAFQSFPVSKNGDEDDSETEHTAEGKGPVNISSEMESSIGGVELQESSISKSIDSEKELKGDECLEVVKEKHDGTYPGTNKQQDNENQEMEEKLQNSVLLEEGTSIPGNELVSCDQKLEVKAEMEKKLQYSKLQREGTSIPGNGQVSCDNKPELAVEKEVNLQNSRLQEEGTSIPGNELVSYDQKLEVEAEEEKSQNSGIQEEGTAITGNELGSGDHEPAVEADEEKSQNSGLQEEGAPFPGNEVGSGNYEPEVEAEEEKSQNSGLQEEGASILRNEAGSGDHEEKLQNSRFQEEGASILGNELNSCEQKAEVEAEGSIKEELVSHSPALQHNKSGDCVEKDGVIENKSHITRS
ncbi:unnamed protein product [Sphenostylis stenocarpa]|uniref:Uncharacterized protein n=1 Tax=Sphenostylis stenocarpa TaxID=92480 RepID=A0AA86S1J8_9FABA|nr:unnamed protein product [Sphenostylis stenocarpa]